jgi:hypothetical protein
MALTVQESVTWNEKFKKVVFLTGTGGGAIAETFNPDVPFQLVELRVESSGAVTTSQEFTVSLDSGAGATFDQELYGVDLSTSGVPHQYLWDENRTFMSTDEIDIAYTNTDANTITFILVVRIGKDIEANSLV